MCACSTHRAVQTTPAALPAAPAPLAAPTEPSNKRVATEASGVADARVTGLSRSKSHRGRRGDSPSSVKAAAPAAAAAPVKYFTPFNSPTLEVQPAIRAICEVNAQRRAKYRDGKEWSKLTPHQQRGYFMFELLEWRKLAAQKEAAATAAEETEAGEEHA